MIEGKNVRTGLLARAASTHGMRLSQGFPTYLDTLPRVKILVSGPRGPVWLDLLREDDGYVDGGAEFSRPEVGKGLLSIRAGRRELEFDMSHEEHPTVRTHTTSLPSQYDTDVPVSLSVSVRPAQGNARIQIDPFEPGALGAGCVLFDWRRMEDTGKTPQERLDEQPRSYPSVTSRVQSLRMWRRVSPTLRRFCSLQSCTARLREIKDIGNRLNTKEAPQIYRYAVNSEGCVAFEQILLDRFVEIATADLDRRLDSEERASVIRSLAYSWTSSSTFQKYILRLLGYANTDLNRWHLLAIGRCLRGRNDIHVFLKTLAKRLKHSHERSFHWLVALSDLLKLREEALASVDTGLCYTMLRELDAIFEPLVAGRGTGFRQYIGRYVCVSIVYMLRRRAYDPDFLDPDEPLALHIKDLFRKLQHLIREGYVRPFGGMVNIEDEIQRFIDYIDRRGRGIISMAEVD